LESQTSNDAWLSSFMDLSVHKPKNPKPTLPPPQTPPLGGGASAVTTIIAIFPGVRVRRPCRPSASGMSFHPSRARKQPSWCSESPKPPSRARKWPSWCSEPGFISTLNVVMADLIGHLLIPCPDPGSFVRNRHGRPDRPSPHPGRRPGISRPERRRRAPRTLIKISYREYRLVKLNIDMICSPRSES